MAAALARTPEIDARRARAEAGIAEDQYILGIMYATGASGVPQDGAEAVRWRRLAADQGYVPAQYNLGSMYETGESIPQDYVQAYMWYDTAASQLCCEMLQHAIENRYRVGSLMNSTRVAEARRLAREWDAAHPREPPGESPLPGPARWCSYRTAGRSRRTGQHV